MTTRDENGERVTPERFVQVWQQANCLRDVTEELGMTPSAARGRAANYRKRGIRLLFLPRTYIHALDVDALNGLADSLNPLRKKAP